MTEPSRYIPADTPVGCIPAEMAVRHDAIELFHRMIDGELPPPPIARTLNIALTAAERGKVEFRGVPLFDHYNPMGAVHGGWPAALLDSALGCAVHSTLSAGTGYATVEFKVNLVRPITAETGEVVCTAEIISRGRSIATSEGRILGPDGKLLAHGTETCAIFPLRVPGK